MSKPTILEAKDGKNNQCTSLESISRRKFLNSMGVAFLGVSASLMSGCRDIRHVEEESELAEESRLMEYLGAPKGPGLRGHLVARNPATKSSYIMMVEEDLSTGKLSFRGLSKPLDIEVERDIIDYIESQTIAVPGTSIVQISTLFTAEVIIKRTPANGKTFRGSVTNLNTGEKIDFVYQDPIPVVVILAGIAALLCLSLIIIETLINDCSDQAIATCGAGNVKSATAKISFSLSNGCTSECSVKCKHNQGGGQ